MAQWAGVSAAVWLQQWRHVAAQGDELLLTFEPHRRRRVWPGQLLTRQHRQGTVHLACMRYEGCPSSPYPSSNNLSSIRHWWQQCLDCQTLLGNTPSILVLLCWGVFLSVGWFRCGVRCLLYKINKTVSAGCTTASFGVYTTQSKYPDNVTEFKLRGAGSIIPAENLGLSPAESQSRSG